MQREEEHKIAYEDGLLKGQQDGLLKGKMEEKLDAARNLIRLNILTNEQIAQAAELPIEQVEKLAKEMKNKSI